MVCSSATPILGFPPPGGLKPGLFMVSAMGCGMGGSGGSEGRGRGWEFFWR